VRRRAFAITALSCSTALLLSSASKIGDPKTFVTDVYRRLIAAQSTHSSYTPPEDIYTARLAKLIRDDRRKAKGEVGCLDFLFWVNGQDYAITNLTLTTTDQGPQQKTVVAKFVNLGSPNEIHFDFQRSAARWLLDDAHSVLEPRWTLSEILKCTP
jgi:hypothetical protein